MNAHCLAHVPARILFTSVLVLGYVGSAPAQVGTPLSNRAPHGGASLVAPPSLNGLQASTLPRSGRMILSGAGFGAAQGTSEVRVAGLSAIVTQWSDQSIHAYVPEAAPLGSVTVLVHTAAGASAPRPLTVVARQSIGRIRWAFELDKGVNLQYVAVAPDGTIYTTDGVATYALTQDGGLLWASTSAWGGRPVSLGADGTIYTGIGSATSASQTLVALRPDGTERWTFTPQAKGSLVSGPNVGPDGKIYAVQESFSFGGIGAFALDTEGELVWSNTGSPTIFSSAGDNSAMAFGPDRVYAAVVSDGATAPVLYAFEEDGDQVFSTWPLAPQAGGSYPVVDPSGRVPFVWGQTGMRVIEPDGSVPWVSLHPSGASVVARPAVDSTGVIYSGDWLGVDLWSLDPDGSTRWVQSGSSDQLESLSVGPGDLVLAATGNGGFGQGGWVRGYHAPSGTLDWQVDFPLEGTVKPLPTIYEPVFSPGGETVYATSGFLGLIEHGRLYAIDAQ